MLNEDESSFPKLTAKEERFCYEYLANGFNGTKAAISAGYSEKSADVIAVENLGKPKIKERVQAMKDNLAETAGISALMIAKEHAKIAFSSIAELHNTWITLKHFEELTPDQKSCIQEISTKVMKQNTGTKRDPVIMDVEYVRVKLYDKQKALENLTKMLGFDPVTRIDHTTKGESLKIILPDEN
jgi:phage terminase small subunit